MTDLGGVKYFLGLEITRSTRGNHVSQAKYTRDLLSRFDMTAAKPCQTPLSVKTVFDTSQLCSSSDVHAYRAIIGAFQYLMFSRPDIVF